MWKRVQVEPDAPFAINGCNYLFKPLSLERDRGFDMGKSAMDGRVRCPSRSTEQTNRLIHIQRSLMCDNTLAFSFFYNNRGSCARAARKHVNTNGIGCVRGQTNARTEIGVSDHWINVTLHTVQAYLCYYRTHLYHQFKIHVQELPPPWCRNTFF